MAQKNTPKYRDPALAQLKPLPFDNVSEEELLELLPGDRASLFLMKFEKNFDIHNRYARYFENAAKERKHILAEIKTYYIHLVERGSWSEKKYAKVLVQIFETGAPLGTAALNRIGLRIDNTPVPRRGGRL